MLRSPRKASDLQNNTLVPTDRRRTAALDLKNDVVVLASWLDGQTLILNSFNRFASFFRDRHLDRCCASIAYGGEVERWDSHASHIGRDLFVLPPLELERSVAREAFVGVIGCRAIRSYDLLRMDFEFDVLASARSIDRDDRRVATSAIFRL